VRILQRPLPRDAGAVLSRAALQETLSSTAGAIFRDGACAPLQSQLVQAKAVEQKTRDTTALVCAVGMLNYLRVLRKAPGCAVSSARLSQGGMETEVLLLEPAQSKKGVTLQVLAAWSPLEKGDFNLLLLAADGTLCEKHKVTLGPGGSP
jgi:hypothetical protein